MRASLAAVAIALVACGSSAGTSQGGATSTPPAASPAQQSHQASATLGGLGENSTKDPALVVCQLRGTVPGLEFHGNLSGPNIGSHDFDVKSGQSSQGVTPPSPDEAVFALPFPGMGGQHGGGPAGPFTCKLTSVDVPAGFTLAAHQPSDWTLTVS